MDVSSETVALLRQMEKAISKNVSTILVAFQEYFLAAVAAYRLEYGSKTTANVRGYSVLVEESVVAMRHSGGALQQARSLKRWT